MTVTITDDKEATFEVFLNRTYPAMAEHKLLSKSDYQELMRVKREYDYIITRINKKINELDLHDYLDDCKEIQDKIAVLKEVLNYV